MENEDGKPKDIDISMVDIFILIIQDNKYFNEICKRTNKSFLPVINKPILFYQLEFLERQKINKVKILIKEDDIETKRALDTYQGPIKYDFITITKDKLGLFDVIKEKLDYKNFILIEGDSILSFNLWELIDNHIDNNNIVSLVLQQKENKLNCLKKLREKTVDIYGIDFEHNNRVVYYRKQNLDDHRNINIKKQLLNHCPKMNFLQKYIDIGLYIFNDSIFDILENKKFKEKISELNIESIREDFIPFLIKQTFSKTLNEILINKYQNQNLLLKANRIKIGAKLIQNADGITSEYAHKIYDYPSYLSIIEEIQKPYDKIKPIFFQTKNNAKNYFSNFKEKIIQNLENNKRYNDGIPELETISDDCYIADKINKIEQNSKIIKTVTDKNLKVGENTEIINCIIGIDSAIGNNCKLKNCIIGDNVIIEDDSEISESIIGDNYNFKNEEKTPISEQILYQLI